MYSNALLQCKHGKLRQIRMRGLDTGRRFTEALLRHFGEQAFDSCTFGPIGISRGCIVWRAERRR